MAKAKKEGKNGIDRWTNNGYGIVNITVPKKPAKKGAKSSGRKR